MLYFRGEEEKTSWKCLPKYGLKQKELVEIQIHIKIISWQGIAITVHFWMEVSLKQNNDFQVNYNIM